MFPCVSLGHLGVVATLGHSDYSLHSLPIIQNLRIVCDKQPSFTSREASSAFFPPVQTLNLSTSFCMTGKKWRLEGPRADFLPGKLCN